jgi:hypothetical protein
VIEYILFAALHVSANGKKRRFAAARMFGRYWGEADIARTPCLVDVKRLTHLRHRSQNLL